MIRYALVFLVVAPVAGCENPDFIIDLSESALPAVVQLRIGQSVRLSGQGLLVTFDQVTADSRCPIGAMCIWQGDAAPKLSIHQMTSPSTACTLHTTLDPKSVGIDGITLTLNGLAPYPRSDAWIDSTSYVATLNIVRSERPAGQRGL